MDSTLDILMMIYYLCGIDILLDRTNKTKMEKLKPYFNLCILDDKENVMITCLNCIRIDATLPGKKYYNRIILPCQYQKGANSLINYYKNII